MRQFLNQREGPYKKFEKKKLFRNCLVKQAQSTVFFCFDRVMKDDSYIIVIFDHPSCSEREIQHYLELVFVSFNFKRIFIFLNIKSFTMIHFHSLNTFFTYTLKKAKFNILSLNIQSIVFPDNIRSTTSVLNLLVPRTSQTVNSIEFLL